MLIPTENINWSDKLKNISLGFIVMLVWFVAIRTLLYFFFDTNIIPIQSREYTPALFFFSCVVAPLWEEAAFRLGPIQIAKTFKPEAMLPAIIISSIVFGWGHGESIRGILVQGVFGFIFSIVYIKNNYSYISSVILHSMWNTFVFSFL